MWRRFHSQLGVIAASCVAAVSMAWLCEHGASAGVDSALPVHLTVGSSAGPCPVARVDSARSGCTQELPDSLRELWSRTIRGGIERPPAVDAQLNIILATSTGELLQLGPDGAEQWRTRTGVGGASSAPVVLSDRTRFVITMAGEAWGLSPLGTARFHTDMTSFGRDARVAPLALDNGSVAVAIRSHLVIVGADGTLRDHADTKESLTGALIGTRDGIVATTDAGAVWLWAPPTPPRKLGSFGGATPEGAALQAGSRLVAVVDGRRMAAFDLQNVTVTTLGTLLGLQGPPAVEPAETSYAASSTGILIGVSRGGEVLRVALAPQLMTPEDAGAPSESRPSPPVVCDHAGRVAFLHGHGRVGVVASDGQVAMASGAACYDPVAIIPAGRKKVLVACRSGTLRMYGL